MLDPHVSDGLLDVKDMEDDDTSIDESDVQTSGVRIEENASWLFNAIGAATDEVSDVDEVRTEQLDPVVVPIDDEHVSKRIDGHPQRLIQSVGSGSVGRSVDA